MIPETDLAKLAPRVRVLQAQDSIRRLKAWYMQWCDELRAEQI